MSMKPNCFFISMVLSNNHTLENKSNRDILIQIFFINRYHQLLSHSPHESYVSVGIAVQAFESQQLVFYL